MFQKMITGLRLRATPPATFLGVFAVVFLLVVITATVVTFILPVSYASTVRIKVEGDVPDINPTGERKYDPYLLQTEFEVIQSQAVLPKVIENLNLNANWAKRYNVEGRLRTSDTMSLLKRRLLVKQYRNTTLMEVKVFSEDPREAAIIANEIAEVYRQYRTEERQKLATGGIEALRKRWDEQNDKVMKAQAKVEALRKELNIANPEPLTEELRANYQPYWQAKRDLENEEQFRKILHMKMSAETPDAATQKASAVTIVDKAEVSARPVKPNKPLNVTIGVLVGIFLASLAGGVAALIVFAWRRTLRKEPLAA